MRTGGAVIALMSTFSPHFSNCAANLNSLVFNVDRHRDLKVVAVIGKFSVRLPVGTLQIFGAKDSEAPDAIIAPECSPLNATSGSGEATTVPSAAAAVEKEKEKELLVQTKREREAAWSREAQWQALNKNCNDAPTRTPTPFPTRPPTLPTAVPTPKPTPPHTVSPTKSPTVPTNSPTEAPTPKKKCKFLFFGCN